MPQLSRQQQIHRNGEEGPIPQRRKRFYLRENKWYYQIRNGQEHGPFHTLLEAKRTLALFLRRSGIVRFTL